MVHKSFSDMKVVALAGGVGGAKLADGLARVLPPENLTVVVNTGDDFEYLGLRICTDLDTVCYTLAGLANPLTGWGRKDETWATFDTLLELGGPEWFRLGDRDLATHLERTRLLNEGKTLTHVTRKFCEAWQIACRVLPMSDDVIATKIETKTGETLDFQEYFAHQGWQPEVSSVYFYGAALARPAPGVIEAIHNADVIVICPSNPLVSIDPILSVAGIRAAAMTKPVVALSPIVGGKAIKGPLAKMIFEMYGIQPSAEWVAGYYRQHFRLDGFLLDKQDAGMVSALEGRGIICKAIQSIMLIEQDRMEVAEATLAFSQQVIERNELQ